LLDCLSM